MIGPNNISTVIQDIMTVADGRSVWIDMESSLRTVDSKNGGKDVFDLNKVFQCIDAVCDAGIYDHPEYVKWTFLFYADFAIANNIFLLYY